MSPEVFPSPPQKLLWLLIPATEFIHCTDSCHSKRSPWEGPGFTNNMRVTVFTPTAQNNLAHLVSRTDLAPFACLRHIRSVLKRSSCSHLGSPLGLDGSLPKYGCSSAPTWLCPGGWERRRVSSDDTAWVSGHQREGSWAPGLTLASSLIMSLL